MATGRRAAVKKTSKTNQNEFLLLLEFIGYRTLIALAAAGSLYFYSGYTNYMGGMSFWRGFSPYFALRFHDAGRLINMGIAWMSSMYRWGMNQIYYWWNQLVVQLQQLTEQHINPFVQENPVLGFGLLALTGFVLSISLFYIGFLVVKRTFRFAIASPSRLSGSVFGGKEEVWSFDPSKKPSEEQIAAMKRSLERIIMRVPALNGRVPKNADATIRELAARSHDTDYLYRAAIYVMGPIKGTGYDNTHELPLTLDQVKKLCMKIGNASNYETLPLSMIVLYAKKGSNDWERFPSINPIMLGNSYPMKVVESVMTENRGWFIWDSRVKKSRVGYGIRA